MIACINVIVSDYSNESSPDIYDVVELFIEVSETVGRLLVYESRHQP